MHAGHALPLSTRIARLLARCGFAPAPDSLVADQIRRGKSPWIDAVHLLWSAWVFITPALGNGYTWRWAALTALTYPLFLALYAKTLLSPRRIAGRPALAMVALCLVLLPWYPSGSSYFVFGCVMLHAGRRRPGLAAYLLHWFVLNALYIAIAWRVGYPWQMFVWMPAMTLIIGTIVNVERVSADKDAELKLSHDEVRRLAALAERERIGRDLHDLLGHTLSLVALKSELAGKLVERDPAAAMRELDDVTRVARDALAQVRSAVTGMRAAGLGAELASARLLLDADRVELQYAMAPVTLPPELETVLALTVREAVMNIQRHARARRAEITLSSTPREVKLCIVDDGRGGAIAPGNGLCGMRERIEALGGRLRVDSSPSGTRVEACLPLPARASLRSVDSEAA